MPFFHQDHIWRLPTSCEHQQVFDAAATLHALSEDQFHGFCELHQGVHMRRVVWACLQMLLPFVSSHVIGDTDQKFTGLSLHQNTAGPRQARQANALAARNG